MDIADNEFLGLPFRYAKGKKQKKEYEVMQVVGFEHFHSVFLILLFM
jgi:hypothetical protein